MTHPRAGQPADLADLVDIAHLVTAYYSLVPDMTDPSQQVSFGTSGHRGSSLTGAFNEAHIVAITQAICEYRASQGIRGPLFLARDTHALSEPAWTSALEVLAANDVDVRVDAAGRFTPTPAVSHAILRLNATLGADDAGRADGIVVTPSHNPPADGGFKYNPPHGGPAGSDVTSVIATRANEILTAGDGRAAGVRRIPITRARAAATAHDFLGDYVADLPDAIDLDAIRAAGLRVGADPLGGASVDYWAAIAERHRLDLEVLNPVVDPTWRFMPLDHDGKIRMDCSSRWAMAGLVKLITRDEPWDQRADDIDGPIGTNIELATGNDADADRHGIVTSDAGLMNPNHFLAVAIDYLLTRRERWPADAAIGKTLVSSSIIDRVVAAAGRRLTEVPVGFKWFVPGLLDGSVAFGGEESAGASFLRRGGGVWTTDKDGILLALLAAEIMAVTGTSPSRRYAELTTRFGEPAYARSDVPASREEKARLGSVAAESVTVTDLAGDQVHEVMSQAPGNGQRIGGLKVVAEDSWFAARPSGTEDLYKIYAESFRGERHLMEVQQVAQEVVAQALDG